MLYATNSRPMGFDLEAVQALILIIGLYLPRALRMSGFG